MDKSMVEMVLVKLEELVIAAGGQLQNFYPCAVRQQFILGAIAGVSFLALLLITIISAKLVRKHWDYLYKKDMEWLIAVPINTGIASLITSIVFIVEGIPRLLNSHFYAVQEIINMAKNLL